MAKSLHNNIQKTLYHLFIITLPQKLGLSSGLFYNHCAPECEVVKGVLGHNPPGKWWFLWSTYSTVCAFQDIWRTENR